MIILLSLSIAYRAPWWRLTIADDLGHVDVSPLDAEIKLLGSTIDVPILWYMNLGAKLTLLLVAAILLFSSLNTHKTYSKKLLDASYKKPVYMVLGIVLFGIITKLLVGSFLPFDIPFIGTSKAVIASEGFTLSVPITASFTWVFWLAALCAGLAIVTKVYHRLFIVNVKN